MPKTKKEKERKIEPIDITFWETSVETNLEILVEKLNEIIDYLNSHK